MTRLKELRRIERVIEEQNLDELEWARGYAQMRVETASIIGLTPQKRKAAAEILAETVR